MVDYEQSIERTGQEILSLKEQRTKHWEAIKRLSKIINGKMVLVRYYKDNLNKENKK